MTRPHTAVLNVMVEVHSLLDTGECSGKTVGIDVLEEHGIKSEFLLSVTGNSLNDCLNKLKNKIKVFNE